MYQTLEIVGDYLNLLNSHKRQTRQPPCTIIPNYSALLMIFAFVLNPSISKVSKSQAVMLTIKLRHLDEEIAYRRKIAQMYLNGIKNNLIQLPLENINAETYNAHVWHLFVIQTQHRERLQTYLTQHGIQTLVHYPIPPHKQIAYKEWNHLIHPITEDIHRNILSLPIGLHLQQMDIDYIIETLRVFE